MTAEQRRSHIWYAIIKNAFEPSNINSQATWLDCFTKTIYGYVDNPVCRYPKCNRDVIFGRIGCGSLDFTCDYEIRPDRSQFDLFLSSLPLSTWHSQYGIENNAFACGRRELELYRDPPAQGEVDEVLSGLIDHPRSHLHLFKDGPMREVRIGTGLHAPFLFLFQLRFQLSIDTARRQDEMNRLKEIFTLTWLANEHAVSPQQLFGQ
jgi:hypothetical protein